LKHAGAATRSAVGGYERNELPSEEVQAIWPEHKKWLLYNKFDRKYACCEKSLSDIAKETEHWQRPAGATGGARSWRPGGAAAAPGPR